MYPSLPEMNTTSETNKNCSSIVPIVVVPQMYSLEKYFMTEKHGVGTNSEVGETFEILNFKTSD